MKIVQLFEKEILADVIYKHFYKNSSQSTAWQVAIKKSKINVVMVDMANITALGHDW
jgi:hypothetical protein